MENKTFTCVITAHSSGDADAIGSMIGASKLYPESLLVWPGSPNKYLQDLIKEEVKCGDPDSIDSISTLVVVDTSNMKRLHHVDALLKKCTEGDCRLIVYDHHPPPSKENDLCLVGNCEYTRELCGAATSIMVRILREKKLVPTEVEATWMGIGIYEDTGSFTYSLTTKLEFDSASWLLLHGMNLSFVLKYLQHHQHSRSDINVEEVKIVEELVDNSSSFHIHNRDIVITRASSDTEPHNFSTLLNIAMAQLECEAIFAIGAFTNIVVVARSMKESVDVGAICQYLGGGGHQVAGAARIRNKTANEVEEEIYALLLSLLAPTEWSLKELMTTPPVFVYSESTMGDAQTMFQNFNLKHMPVVERESNKLVGILDRNTADRAVGHGLDSSPVRIYMNTQFSHVRKYDPPRAAFDICLGTKQRLVPVVTSDESIELEAVISRADVMAALMKDPSRFPARIGKQPKNLSAQLNKSLSRELMQFLHGAGKLADEIGLGLYVVGGFVRDLIIAMFENDDIDLVVEGDDGNGPMFAEELNKLYGKGKVTHHKKFLTSVVTLKSGLKIDVTTARLEYYPQPVVLPMVELSCLKMDLSRRDFTINAIALQLNHKAFGDVVDFFDGESDIRKRKINVLHALSFVEDPTRIFRAIRYEQRYGFSLGPQTLKLLKSAIKDGYVRKLTGSRRFHEIEKILCDKKPVECLRRLETSFGIFSDIDKSLNVLDYNCLAKAMEIYQYYELLEIEDEVMKWKFYFYAVTKSVKVSSLIGLLRSFMFPDPKVKLMVDDIKNWRRIVHKLHPLDIEGFPAPLKMYMMLKDLSIESLLMIVTLLKSSHARIWFTNYLTSVRFTKTEINGNDLIKMGYSPGHLFHKALYAVKIAKLDGEVGNDKESQLTLAKTVLDAPISDP